jgi:hypothetical protein
VAPIVATGYYGRPVRCQRVHRIDDFVGGSSEWKLPLALAVTVLVSTYLVRIPTMWRQAPITAAIVVASGLTQHSKRTGVEHGLHKVAEVFLGCLMGLVVSYLMSRVWPLPDPAKKPVA